MSSKYQNLTGFDLSEFNGVERLLLQDRKVFSFLFYHRNYSERNMSSPTSVRLSTNNFILLQHLVMSKEENILSITVTLVTVELQHGGFRLGWTQLVGISWLESELQNVTDMTDISV